MVNWKNSESNDRLFAAVIAAHPGLKVLPPHSYRQTDSPTNEPQLDYQAMATYFGQGATYDAIEGRFRRYRKMAEDLKTEARDRGIVHVPRGRGSGVTTPRTPRTGRGITKNTSSSKSKKDANRSNLTSPSRRGAARSTHAGMSSLDAICLDGNTSDEDERKADKEPEVKSETSAILWGQGGAAALGQRGPEVEILGADVPAEPVGAVFPKLEDRENSISTFGRIKREDRADQNLPAAATAIGLDRRGTPLDQTGLNEDVFHQAGLYFPTNHPEYPMDTLYVDDMYNGTA